MLKAEDIKGMDKKAIEAKVKEFRVELFNLRMQKGTMGVEKSHTAKVLKKNIARLLTAANANQAK